MKDRVAVSDLKAHLSAHLRAVKGGKTITILQHGHPVARLVPYAPSFTLQAARRDIRKVNLPHTARGTTHVVDDLIADRRRR